MKGPIVVCTLLVCGSMHADADVEGCGHHRLSLQHAVVYGGALPQSTTMGNLFAWREKIENREIERISNRRTATDVRQCRYGRGLDAERRQTCVCEARRT
jgi:hypothetical protein